MSNPHVSSDDFLTIGPRIRVLPIIHGSGDFAVQVREELLSRPYDCVALPLPPSFQEDVEAAVDRLPAISVVVQVDAEVRRRRDGGRAGLQLRTDRPLSGGDRRDPDGAGRTDCARIHRPGDAAVCLGHPRLSRPLRAQACQSRALRRGNAGGCPASAVRARSPGASPGWRRGSASWNPSIA